MTVKSAFSREAHTGRALETASANLTFQFAFLANEITRTGFQADVLNLSSSILSMLLDAEARAADIIVRTSRLACQCFSRDLF